MKVSRATSRTVTSSLTLDDGEVLGGDEAVDGLLGQAGLPGDAAGGQVGRQQPAGAGVSTSTRSPTGRTSATCSPPPAPAAAGWPGLHAGGGGRLRDVGWTG